ncbi:unnamed protein product [Parascedosporium putredinis]|uniref:Uncharacterized protein n=1 Tax=Parascedosporium putredinis TaxID=1442378 RepID=A0A9P1H6K1_9PEZI|nr:unnamed protein product [Parascedosporium putredinis]CAI7997602.1 unnamed protein product [Parascedosporium putredinis]
MGRSTRARKYQENRSAKPSTPQRTSPRSKTNRNGKSSSTAPALAAQLVTPSSPSSSESHTEVAQEIVVWTEGMTISSASHDEEPNESPLSKADLDLREAPDPTVQSEVVSETIESSLSVFTDASELSSLLSTISSGVTTPIEVDAPTHVLLGAPTARRARKSPSISTFSSLTSIADGNDSAIGSPTVISAQTLPSLVASTTVDVDSLSPPLNPLSRIAQIPGCLPAAPETPALCDNVAKLAPPASDTTRRPFYASPNISDVQGPERIVFNVRPKSSIPSDLSPAEYASQCIEGAENSRLNPFILHAGEYEILRNHLSYVQVTTYLNIRNGILRLWIRNPAWL